MIAAVMLDVTFLAGKNSPNSKFFDSHPLIFSFSTVVLVAIQFIFNNIERRYRHKKSRDSLQLISADLLTQTIESALIGFEGTFDVYNAEMNTLENQAFWTRLCKHNGISQIRIAIPENVFKRFEQAIAPGNPPYVFAKYADKIHVLPLCIPVERAAYAYALLNSDGAGDGYSTIFIFPKIDPLSRLRRRGRCQCSTIEQRHHSSDDLHWQYRHFLFGGPSALLDEARTWFSQEWHDDDAFSPREMITFAKGDRLAPDQIREAHSLATSDPVIRMFHRESTSTIVDTEVPNELKALDYSICKLIKSDFGTGSLCVRGSGTTERPHPAFIWLPPWGFTDWPKRLERFDETIIKELDAKVIHVRSYSMQTQEFNVSGAVRDATAVFKDMITNHASYGINKDCMILCGVSISAFVAAEIAAAFRKHVVGVCLLSPVIDLIEALDSFRTRDGFALFTRGVYFGKRRCTVSELRNRPNLLRLIQKEAGVGFFLDIPFRGARCCSAAHMQKNVAEYTRNPRNKVFVASNKHDQMTPWQHVERLWAQATAGGLKHREFSWIHDITHKNSFDCELPKSLDEPEWKDLREFSKNCIDRNCGCTKTP